MSYIIAFALSGFWIFVGMVLGMLDNDGPMRWSMFFLLWALAGGVLLIHSSIAKAWR